VAMGQRVNAGTPIGTVGPGGGGRPSHLHFEVRQNSPNGWVAQDPSLYLPGAP
jgi:murein DD-endopeptidase MepM/ murein hydrolase activator NlpD